MFNAKPTQQNPSTTLKKLAIASAFMLGIGAASSSFANNNHNNHNNNNGRHGANPSLPLESYQIATLAQDQHSVFTDIVINAPARDVWRVLTDFNNMPNWSSSLKGITGDIRDGGKVTVLFQIQDQLNKIPHVLRYKKDTSFGWSEETVGIAPGIFDDHTYLVVPISHQRTRFIQKDTFRGVSKLAGVNTAVLAEGVRPIYQQFNRELKAEVERQAAK